MDSILEEFRRLDEKAKVKNGATEFIQEKWEKFLMDIKYFDGITPKQIDRIVEKFCKQINYSPKPQYIGVIPWEKSKINDCVNNVKEYLKNHERKSNSKID